MDYWLLKYRLKKLLFPTRIKSKEYIEYLKRNGIIIGEGSYFFYPYSNTIDTQRPWMLRIGSYCKITEGVSILTHDYSRSVLRKKYGEVIAEAKETIIGDNVFIGLKSTILMGARIGDNVIIGAGSVVSGNIPDNTVVAGVPAKVVCSLNDYYNKRCESTLNDAVVYAKAFMRYYNRRPSVKEMGAFFPLYLERSIEALRQNGISTNLSGDNEQELIDVFLKTKPLFNSFEEFINYVEIQK